MISCDSDMYAIASTVFEVPLMPKVGTFLGVRAFISVKVPTPIVNSVLFRVFVPEKFLDFKLNSLVCPARSFRNTTPNNGSPYGGE